MYLKVVFLSDICNGEGTKIEQSYWDGQPTHSMSKYLWPRMSLPTQQDWNLWRQWLTSGLSLGRGQQLSLPLRPWQAHVNEAPGYFMDITGHHLYSLHEQKWYSHAKIPHHCRQKEYHRTGQVIERPLT